MSFRTRTADLGFGAIVLGLLPLPTEAGSLVSEAIPLFFDASVPSTGRGQASTAVFWDEGPNHWANPALAAFHRGIRYEENDTQLVPDLTDDIFHRTRRWTFGAYGIGLVTAGRPLSGLGYQELDYGVSEFTDASGNVTEYESREEIEVFGVGLSAGDLLASFAPHVGVGGHPLARYADVAVGFATKRFKSFLHPAIGELPEDRGEATVNDWGVLVRVTPIDTMNYPGSSPTIGEAVPVRVDGSVGHAVLGFNDATIQHVEGGPSPPIARMTRTGWSVHAAIGLPVPVREKFRSGGVGWLAEFVDPIVRFGYGSDTSRCETPGFVNGPFEIPATESSDIQGRGWELTLANVFTIRRGNVENRDLDIDGDADGWGAGLRLGRFGGFRYDKATQPQATGLERVEREGWSAFVDPLAIWDARRARSGGE